MSDLPQESAVPAEKQNARNRGSRSRLQSLRKRLTDDGIIGLVDSSSGAPVRVKNENTRHFDRGDVGSMAQLAGVLTLRRCPDF